MTRKCFALGALTLALAACNRNATPAFTAADSAAVDSVRARWVEAYNAGNVDGVAALYTDSALFYSGNMPAAAGRAAIRAQIARDFADTTMHPRVWADAGRVDGYGYLAIAAGHFRTTPTGDTTMTLPGKYLVVLKHFQDGWRIAYHHGSLDVMPPMPPAPPAAGRR